jgi:hypothetical protein
MRYNYNISTHLEHNFPKILTASAVFYFYKTAFWPITYLFIGLFAIAWIIFFIKFRWETGLLGYLKTFYLPLLLVAIFLLAFLFDFQINKTVLKDILLLGLLFSLFYLFYWNTEVQKKKIPLLFTYNLIIIVTTIISLINLFFVFFANKLPQYLIENFHISDGPVIANDYNFFALFMIIGLILLNYKYENPLFSQRFSVKIRTFLNILFILNILFSSSRRGIVILIVLFLFYYFIYLCPAFLKKISPRNIFKLIGKLIIVAVLVILVGLIVYLTIPKQKLSIVVYRYATLIGINDFKKIEKFLWQHNPKVPKDKSYLINRESMNPEYEYWKELSEGTFLSGLNTPFGYGIKMEKKGLPLGFSIYYVGPDIIYYAQHTYKISFKIKFIEGNTNSFFLGWWADDGGKGYSNTLVLDKHIESLDDGWYNCTSYYTFLNNHIGLPGFFNTVADGTSFIIADFSLADLNWNKDLPRFEFEYQGPENILAWVNRINAPWKNRNLIINGDFKHGLSFWKTSANEVNIEIVKEDTLYCAKIIRGNGNESDWSLYYNGNTVKFFANNEYELSFMVKPLESTTIPFNVGFWVDDGEGYKISLSQELTKLNNNWQRLKVRYTFKNDWVNPFFPINCQKNNSSFLIADIKLINLSYPQEQEAPNIGIEQRSFDNRKPIDEGRVSRLNFATEIWKSKYNGLNKLFGHGFDYYSWYTEKYPNDKELSDYPHNPLISILFYSGVLGLIIYFWLLVKVFHLYIKYRKSVGSIMICFIITLFFSFFSGSSPFDPPIMGFFIVLPYYIQLIEKSNYSNIIRKNE